MKRVVITGASDGIGRSIAIRLAKDGYKPVLFGRDEARLKAVSQECGSAEYFPCDLNDHSALAETVARVLAAGDVDGLINNAGVWHKMGDLETIEDEKIIEVINTNLTSQILLTKKLLPHLRNRDGSVIVNVASKSGVTAQPGQTVYSASKWGMRGFTEVLTADTKDDKVKVVGVYQSGTNTRLFEKAGEDFSTETFTHPDDLAGVIAFILSQPDNLKITDIRIER